MLVLSRRVTGKLYFPDIGMVIHVLALKGSAVSLGIEAPPQVTVLRDELRRRPARTPGAGQPAGANHLVRKALSFDSLLQFALRGVEAARLGLESGPIEDVKALLKTIQEDLARLRQLLPTDERCAAATPHAAPLPERVPAAIKTGPSKKPPPARPARAGSGNSKNRHPSLNVP
jgi:carbon storage regulator CsrA